MAGPVLEISKLKFRLRALSREVWVRVTAFAVLGAMTALIGFWIKDFIPQNLPAKIGADAIESILQILASSMLTVTTFSLSILTAAYAAAGSSATPRSVRLLVADSVSQTVLATFIGAFLFSLVSIILLKTEIYGEAGRLVLFAVTILVVLIVVISLLRWIDHLGRLGRMGDTLKRVGNAAADSLKNRLDSPWMGANPLRGEPPSGLTGIMTDDVGYLLHCDVGELSDLADRAGTLIYLMVTPGDFLTPAKPVMYVSAMPSDEDEADSFKADLLDCLTIDDSRNFDQDPRFGLQVLSEIAQRALSPGINDPGTAVQAISQILKVLRHWKEEAVPVVEYPRIYVPTLIAAEIIEDTLLPIAHDGAGNFQVQKTLQQALLALRGMSPNVFGDPAGALSRKILDYSNESVALKSQREELASLSENNAA